MRRIAVVNMSLRPIRRLHTIVSVAQEGGTCDVERLSQQYERMSPDDQRTFDRWISANAIFGAILALGVLAMAVAGSNAPGSAAHPERSVTVGDAP